MGESVWIKRIRPHIGNNNGDNFKKGPCLPRPKEESCIAHDHELIIGMDSNDDNKTTSDVQKFHCQNNLVDVFTHLHPRATPPHKYQCGNNQINYIFITPAMVPALRSTGYLPFNIPFISNHSAAYANFDEEVLFLGCTNNPVDSAKRNLISSNPKCRDNYCDDIKEQFSKHKVVVKVNALYSKIKSNQYNLIDMIDKFETLDRQITEMMLQAKRKCRTCKTGKPWSIKLVRATRQVKYWKTRKSDCLNNCHPSPSLLQLGFDLNITYDQLPSEAIMANLTKAHKNL
eukprot:15367193-Ditylum_brightwellii.AAC.5